MKRLPCTFAFFSVAALVGCCVAVYYFASRGGEYYVNKSHAQTASTNAALAQDASGSSTKRIDVPKIRFYGQVIDETGSPISDARVDILIRRMPPGSPAPDLRPGEEPPRHLSDFARIHTDENGKFTVEDEGYTLQIVGIRKNSEYTEVFDWAWDWPAPYISDPYSTNRYFIYGGDFPIYIPDKEHPAIYPLHRKGSQAIGMPSRGGSNKLADGRIIRNEPKRPVVPSTGPGSPTTNTERIERVRQLHRPAASTQSTE